jgi:hypothetical protein
MSGGFLPVGKLLALASILAITIIVPVAVTLPPHRLVLEAPQDGSISGILHVHSNRSDGLRSPDEVAVAAARAGLKFVVFTDHGDATRTPDPPAYRSGVLCLDGVEISTNGGHYIAIDMPASPYPIAGEARDVVEDVRRLGGFGIVAHPDSPKPQLNWQSWDAGFDGIELLNPDTSWRLLAARSGWRTKWQLVRGVIDYPFRAPEVIASLIQPSGAVASWESAAAVRRVVAIAGADAHARLALRSTDPGQSRFVLPMPGYETTFRVMSVHVRPERPFNGNAREDGAVLVRAIRNGHLYTAIDGLASPPSFDFTATNAQGTVREGDELTASGSVQLHVRSNAPSGFVTIVHADGKAIATARDAPDLVVHASDRPAAYWVEIVDSSRTPPLTWIRSNPVYVRSVRAVAKAPEHRIARAFLEIFDGASTRDWGVEHDALSASSVDVTSYGANAESPSNASTAPGAAEAPGLRGSLNSTPTTNSAGGAELRFRYGLAGGASAGQAAALVADTRTGIAAYDRLAFTIRSDRPMRISVQLRDTANERWQRSVYVNQAPQERSIAFDEFLPVGRTATVQPVPANVRGILFVVDGTNTKPGASGRIWFKRVALEK